MGFVDTTRLPRFTPDRMSKVNLFETAEMFCDLYCLEPGQEQRLHHHADATKFYYVIEGRATIQIGGERRTLGPGGLAYAPPGVEHGASNAGPDRAVLLVAMGPNPNVRRGAQ